MTAMKWGIFVLSATVSCFVVLLVAVIFMIFRYRKKLQNSYLLQDSQSVHLQPVLQGPKKPYIERFVQYLLGYSESSDTSTDEERASSGGLTKLVHVQPFSDSDTECPPGTPPPEAAQPRRHSVENVLRQPSIDPNQYRNRSFTDTPSPNGKSGIYRARESLFYKFGRVRKESYDDGDSSDGHRSPSLSGAKERLLPPFPRKTPASPDPKSKVLFDGTLKVTGKPPLSPKVGATVPSTPTRPFPSVSKIDRPRRFSDAMVLEKSHKKALSELNFNPSGLRSFMGSMESLTPGLGSLDVNLWYSKEERLLKVCVLNVNNPNEERSLVDSYIKVAFYLFEKPYKNEMQLWSDSTKSLVKRTFSYLVKDASDLQRATLRFTLSRKNSLVRNKVLGKAILRLCGKDLLELKAYTLKLEHSVTELHGELLVSVCHHATAGILFVGIVRAMGLAKTMRKTMGELFEDKKYEELGNSKHVNLGNFLQRHDGKFLVDTYYTDFFGYNGTSNINGFIKRV